VSEQKKTGDKLPPIVQKMADQFGRRGLKAGWTPEELRHVALLAITTLGWPSAMTALSWIEEELEKQGALPSQAKP